MKKIALYVFAILFLLAGVSHFVLEPFFTRAMPDWVPFRPVIVYISGIMEIVLAIGLMRKRTRRKAGVFIAIFLVLIFPVNIYMALVPEQYSVPAYALWLRLPLQFVLIWWVLKVRKVV